jgi:hypothetical protein
MLNNNLQAQWLLYQNIPAIQFLFQYLIEYIRGTPKEEEIKSRE